MSDKPAATLAELPARLSRAVGLLQAGKGGMAEAICREVLAADAENFDAIHLLGLIESQRGHHLAALAHLDHAQRLQPANVEVRRNRELALRRHHPALAARAADLQRKGKLQQAEALYRDILQREPQHFDALQLLGALCNQTRRFDDALDYLDRAIALHPRYAGAHANRGVALRKLGRIAEALAAYDTALALEPDHAEALCNRGVALRELKRFDEALASYGRAIALKPDYASAHLNRSLATLLLGDFASGWPEYEWRWKRPGGAEQRHTDKPRWTGATDLDGLTLLLWCEQGLGDTLQFCRFTRELAARGARVILEVQPPLLPVLSALPGAASVHARGDELPAFDLQCPLLSLPLALKLKLDDLRGAPYLPPPPRRPWLERQTNLPAVGVAWSGSSAHDDDLKRSMSFKLFRQCLPKSMRAVSLQKDVRAGDLDELNACPTLVRVEARLDSLADTAALIAKLDLVVTVDTAIAHLAGAMGKEVWILLPHVPDFRWLLDRDDSPWYDSATLFRQPAPGDWASVLADINARLKKRFGDS